MDLIKTLAARGYTDARPITRPEPVSGTQQIGAMAQDFIATLQAAEQTAEAALTGKATKSTTAEMTWTATRRVARASMRPTLAVPIPRLSRSMTDLPTVSEPESQMSAAMLT